MNGEVKVIITDSTNTTSVEFDKNAYSQKANLSSLTSVAKTSGLTVPSAVNVSYLVSTVKQAGSMALANVGKYTGSTEVQTNVNNLVYGIGLGVALYTNPVAAITATTFNVTQTMLNEKFRRTQENMQLSVNRMRNGYTDTKSILTSRRH